MKQKTLIFSLLALAILISGGLFLPFNKSDEPEYSHSDAASAQEEQAPVSKSIEDKVASLAVNIARSFSKPSVLLDLTFVSQAPFGVWDALHEETCEEASMVMAHYYVTGQKLDAQIMDDQLLKMVPWEEERGMGVSIHMKDVQRTMKEFLGNDQTRLIANPTIEVLKKELEKENPIIVPAAGRELGNPNFRGLGPIYHMYVLVGYDDGRKEFIAHDPGTRKGKNYRYPYDVVMNSLHDWDEENIKNGEKVVLVVDKSR